MDAEPRRRLSSAPDEGAGASTFGDEERGDGEHLTLIGTRVCGISYVIA